MVKTEISGEMHGKAGIRSGEDYHAIRAGAETSAHGGLFTGSRGHFIISNPSGAVYYLGKVDKKHKLPAWASKILQRTSS